MPDAHGNAYRIYSVDEQRTILVDLAGKLVTVYGGKYDMYNNGDDWDGICYGDIAARYERQGIVLTLEVFEEEVLLQDREQMTDILSFQLCNPSYQLTVILAAGKLMTSLIAAR